MKYTHGQILEITSDYIEGDLVKYRLGENSFDSYSKIKHVKTILTDTLLIQQKYIMINGDLVGHEEIKDIVQKVWTKRG